MNTSADAADQVVRMSLNGAEVALKVSGKGALEISRLLISALKSSANQQHKTKGSIRLNNLIRSGKKLDVAELADSDLKQFCETAKRYGILYTVLKDKNSNSGKTEIMYKSEDKEKIGRIFKKLGLQTVDMAEVKKDVQRDMNGQAPVERTEKSEKDADAFVDRMMEKANPTKEETENANPPQTRAEKQNPSVSSSEKRKKDRTGIFENPENERRKSVRKELKEIREEQRKRATQKRRHNTRETVETNEHKPTQKKKKERER